MWKTKGGVKTCKHMGWLSSVPWLEQWFYLKADILKNGDTEFIIRVYLRVLAL